MLNFYKFFKSFKNIKKFKMDWNSLNSVDQLAEIDEKSKIKKQIIFKHSTRCSVSNFAKRILLAEFSEDLKEKVDVYYLDLISFREVSNNISSHYNVIHESPQLLVIENGKCVYSASHSDVSIEKALS